MRRALALVVSLLAAWIGLVPPAAAASTPTETHAAYTYDSHDHSALVTQLADERAPPPTYDLNITP